MNADAILKASETILSTTLTIAIFGISISLILLLYRILTGPTNPDRAAGLDVIGINLMSIAVIMAILLGTNKLNDVILLIGILSFIGTIGISKYIEKGVLIERDLD